MEWGSISDIVIAISSAIMAITAAVVAIKWFDNKKTEQTALLVEQFLKLTYDTVRSIRALKRVCENRSIKNFDYQSKKVGEFNKAIRLACISLDFWGEYKTSAEFNELKDKLKSACYKCRMSSRRAISAENTIDEEKYEEIIQCCENYIVLHKKLRKLSLKNMLNK
ncbi:hypothetical protein PL78_04220 [Yersinia entomophaga]|uniref:Uncharacterized protein n=1 Tax=Yersinia entomophaga TaxID=935293 RepID=A0ABN4PT46_YERET|nr:MULTISPECIES: hypothetical protein [Yersinia]ANI29045.1 hypothetical protein PL78_04220 [Yersinia entomophaga]OWF87568.1 hypothetical protein B4914_11330 [Yersinia entomophaga]